MHLDPEFKIIAITFAVFFGGGLALTCWVNWRAGRKNRPREFIYRNAGAITEGRHIAPLNNSWEGFLVTDQPMDPTACEELRAAVERYRAAWTKWPPDDGDRFRLREGQLWRI